MKSRSCEFVVTFAALTLLLCGAGQVAADLIVNGSFETPVNTHGQGGNDTANQNFVDYYAPGDPAQYEYNSYPGALLTGWTVLSGSVDIVNTSGSPWGWDAAIGPQSLDLNGWDSGTISQTFATNVGQSYNLIFEYANNPWGTWPSTGPTALVTVAGLSMSLSHLGSSPSAMDWVPVLQSFTADSSLTTLTFASTSPGTGGIALDAVSVTTIGPNTSTVPEPSSFALLGLGGIGLAIGAYRRRMTAV